MIGKIWRLAKFSLPLQSDFESKIGRWCNGNTTGFGSVIPGSNPSRPTFHIYLMYARKRFQ